MKRWLNSVLAFISIFYALSVQAGEPGSWDYFVDHFISPDGRVIDFFQDEISHSEGQGYGMLLAVTHQDKVRFDLLWKWTRQHLQVRGSDALSAWSWGKRPTGERAPIDYNNASDGDVCIAWALLLAHQRWNRPDCLEEAIRIIRSMRRFLLLERHGFTVLLPGYYGYIDAQGMVLNPSYWVFPAYRLFGRYDDRLQWQRAHTDALKLLQELPEQGMPMVPDWFRLTDEGVSALPEKPPLFGYEAVRVALYLAWDGSLAEVPFVVDLIDKIEKTGHVPLSIDIKQQAFSKEEGSGGFYGVMARAALSLDRTELAEKLWKKAEEKLSYEKDDYYSQVLYLFSRMKVAP